MTLIDSWHKVTNFKDNFGYFDFPVTVGRLPFCDPEQDSNGNLNKHNDKGTRVGWG